MSVAILLRKKDFIESRNVCVESKWWRVPMVDTPEWNVCRKSMLERTDNEPLSQKLITIYKSKGRNIVKNRNGNPVSIATYRHTHSATKVQIEEIHKMVVQAVEDDLLSLEESSLDLSLRGLVE